MQVIKNVSMAIIRLFLESIQDMHENHKIVTRPTEYANEFLKNTEMHYPSDLDNNCI